MPTSPMGSSPQWQRKNVMNLIKESRWKNKKSPRPLKKKNGRWTPEKRVWRGIQTLGILKMSVIRPWIFWRSWCQLTKSTSHAQNPKTPPRKKDSNKAKAVKTNKIWTLWWARATIPAQENAPCIWNDMILEIHWVPPWSLARRKITTAQQSP